MSNMRILQLTTEYPPAKGYGLARYASELAAALAETGHEIHVVTCNYNEGQAARVHKGVYVYFLDKATEKYFKKRLEAGLPSQSEGL